MAVEHHGTWPLNGVLLNLPAKSQAQKAVTSFTSRPFALFTSASSFCHQFLKAFWNFHPHILRKLQSTLKPHMSYRKKICHNSTKPKLSGNLPGEQKKIRFSNLRSSADPWWPISRTNDFSRHLPRDWNGPTWPPPVRLGWCFLLGKTTEFQWSKFVPWSFWPLGQNRPGIFSTNQKCVCFQCFVSIWLRLWIQFQKCVLLQTSSKYPQGWEWRFPKFAFKKHVEINNT